MAVGLGRWSRLKPQLSRLLDVQVQRLGLLATITVTFSGHLPRLRPYVRSSTHTTYNIICYISSPYFTAMGNCSSDTLYNLLKS